MQKITIFPKKLVFIALLTAQGIILGLLEPAGETLCLRQRRLGLANIVTLSGFILTLSLKVV